MIYEETNDATLSSPTPTSSSPAPAAAAAGAPPGHHLRPVTGARRVRLAVRVVGVEPGRLRGSARRRPRALRRRALFQRKRARRRLSSLCTSDGTLRSVLSRRLLLERRFIDVRSAALALADSVGDRERGGLAVRRRIA